MPDVLELGSKSPTACSIENLFKAYTYGFSGTLSVFLAHPRITH
jgi:hypothetical protein